MEEITKEIEGMLPYWDEIVGLMEDIPGIGFMGESVQVPVDIIYLKPDDVFKSIGIRSQYPFEIVTNKISPRSNINGKTVEIRTPITINESSYNRHFTDKCWDIFDEIGLNNYMFQGMNGYLMLYCCLPEKQVTKEYLFTGIRMIETIAQDYRSRLSACGFNCI